MNDTVELRRETGFLFILDESAGEGPILALRRLVSETPWLRPSDPPALIPCPYRRGSYDEDPVAAVAVVVRVFSGHGVDVDAEREMYALVAVVAESLRDFTAATDTTLTVLFDGELVGTIIRGAMGGGLEELLQVRWHLAKERRRHRAQQQAPVQP